MATRARFGRLPRQSPSLTSTIVALAQQYQGARDRNIEDAWKEGGLFEGKKVTDEMFIKHWKTRLGEVSTDDPMWDYYNNMIYQYDFQIEESKMGLKYAEEKVSDGAMAAFYRKWAAKLPVHSEAYRSLMTQAAKFKAAATARANGRRARGASDAYGNAQQRTYNSEEAPYMVALSAIANAAVQRGFLDVDDLKKDDYGLSSLTNTAVEDDPMKLSALLTDMMNDPGFQEAVALQIKAYDPSFSGVLNQQTLATLAANARNGAGLRAHRARSLGKKDDTTAAEKAMDTYSMTNTQIGVSMGQDGKASFVESNDFYRSQMDLVLNNPGASELEKNTAIERYRTYLTGEGARSITRNLPPGALDPTSQNFDIYANGILGRLTNTVDALSGTTGNLSAAPDALAVGGLTLKDDLYGLASPEAGKSSDAFILGNKAADVQFKLNALASGTAITVKVNEQGKPDPNGSAWAVFARDAPEVLNNDNLIPIAVPATGSYIVRAAPGGDPERIAAIYKEHGLTPEPDGLAPIVGGVGLGGGEIRYMVAQDVKVAVSPYRDPNTGALSGDASPYEGMDNRVGKELTFNGPGGVPTTLFGVYTKGRLVWTTTDPFRSEDGTNRTRTVDGEGNVVYNFWGGMEPTATTAGATLPKQQYDPYDLVMEEQLMSPSLNDDFDPAIDKQTAWDSPMSTVADMSTEHQKWAVNDIGLKAMGQVENEWFSNPRNWTPDMTAKRDERLQQGWDPAEAQRTTVFEKSREAVWEIEQKALYGWTPEQQQASRAWMRMRQEGTQAAREGVSVETIRARGAAEEEAKVRNDLTFQLSRWGAENASVRYDMTHPRAHRGAGGEIVGGQPSITGGLPRGWTAGDLLNQPGMSLTAAKDLAWTLSGGTVGSPTDWGNSARQTPSVGGMPMLGTKTTLTPNANPYLPKGGGAYSGMPGVAPRPAAVPGLGSSIARDTRPQSIIKPRPVPAPKITSYDEHLPGMGSSIFRIDVPDPTAGFTPAVTYSGRTR